MRLSAFGTKRTCRWRNPLADGWFCEAPIPFNPYRSILSRSDLISERAFSCIGLYVSGATNFGA